VTPIAPGPGAKLAASPAAAAPGDWWQFGYTAADTRFNPDETTIAPATSAVWLLPPGRRRPLVAATPPTRAASPWSTGEPVTVVDQFALGATAAG
jgi:hypothetical protein